MSPKTEKDGERKLLLDSADLMGCEVRENLHVVHRLNDNQCDRKLLDVHVVATKAQVGLCL